MKTRMEAVVEAIAQYAPSFPDEIQGCTSEEIARLQTAVGRPLPQPYVEYLQVMGHGTGPLVFFNSSDFSFGAMLRIYERRVVLMPPERYFMFGVAEDDPYYNFYLDCGAPEPHVVRFPIPETAAEFPEVIRHLDWLASSLHELVFSKAYFDYRLPMFSQQSVLAEDDGHPLDPGKVEGALKKMGMVRHPQSTASVLYYEGPSVVAVLNRTLGAPWVINVATHERRELIRVADILTQQFQLLPAS
jgi:hypothetical protein